MVVGFQEELTKQSMRKKGGRGGIFLQEAIFFEEVFTKLYMQDLGEHMVVPVCFYRDTRAKNVSLHLCTENCFCTKVLAS